jgi:hypothetical protein
LWKDEEEGGGDNIEDLWVGTVSWLCLFELLLFFFSKLTLNY